MGEQVSDDFHRAAFKLKQNNAENNDSQIFINTYLSAYRASLAYITRKFKKLNKVTDSWKPTARSPQQARVNKICVISSAKYLRKY